MSLALWLRTGRTERGLSLDDVARVTKIQARILERLEGGKLDGLPAEVFVRGFIRSFAKCCGLDESEALTRYSAASAAQQTATSPAMPGTLGVAPTARAVVEAMADLAPQAARVTNRISVAAPIEIVDLAAGSLAMPVAAVEAMVAEPEPVKTDPEAVDAKPVSNRQKKKQRGKKRATKRATQRSEMATGTPSVPTPIVVERIEVEATADEPEAAVEEAPVVEAAAVEETPAVVDHLDPLVEPADANEDVVATETWQPKMPATAPVPSAPWRRSAYAATAKAIAVPTLVIDDADPDSAEQVVEDRAAAKAVLTNAQRRSFLPPILLDREDRSARQGGLTLAVIILLIAATLTLSYLMRRPSSSGDGVTSNDTETQPELVVG